MDDFETFRKKIANIKNNKKLEKCDTLSIILNNMIVKKEELNKLDTFYYRNCDKVKSIIQKNNISTEPDLDIINVIDLKNKKIYYDEEHQEYLYDKNKYETYKTMYEMKEILDQINKSKEKNNNI